jgi:hypothetical protein
LAVPQQLLTRPDQQKPFQAVPRRLPAFAPSSDNVVTLPAPNRSAAKLSGLFAGTTQCHPDSLVGAVGRRRAPVRGIAASSVRPDLFVPNDGDQTKWLAWASDGNDRKLVSRGSVPICVRGTGDWPPVPGDNSASRHAGGRHVPRAMCSFSSSGVSGARRSAGRGSN